LSRLAALAGNTALPGAKLTETGVAGTWGRAGVAGAGGFAGVGGGSGWATTLWGRA